MAEFETTIRVLEERIEELTRELEETTDKLTEARHVIAGSENGWRSPVDVQDDESLPIPRLEMVFEPSPTKGWRQHVAMYRLVIRHLRGNLQAIPLGSTRVSGGDGSLPGMEDLPMRDGAHIHHDTEHLRLPAFVLLPGQLPVLLTDGEYERTHKLGREHRRDV